jgi:hypothetical protein
MSLEKSFYFKNESRVKDSTKITEEKELNYRKVRIELLEGGLVGILPMI